LWLQKNVNQLKNSKYSLFEKPGGK